MHLQYKDAVYIYRVCMIATAENGGKNSWFLTFLQTNATIISICWPSSFSLANETKV